MIDVTCMSRRANEEIAQVRAKANSDGTALTASLRKEQMKNDSLEQALQQKVPDPTRHFLFCLPPPLDWRPPLASSPAPPSEPRDRGADQDLRRADRQNGENRLSDLLQRSQPSPSASLLPLDPHARRRPVHVAALSVTPAPPRLLMDKKMQVTSCV